MLMNDIAQLEYVYYISGLLYKHIFQEINDDELTALYIWVFASPENEGLFEEMKDPVAFSESFKCFQKIYTTSTYQIFN